MKQFGNVDQYSKAYSRIRTFIVNPWHFLWYKKKLIVGKKKLPKHTPIIFAPCHQNALMDALALLCSNPFQIVWLARADIFKSATVRKILFFLKILPVYRQRDGVETLGRNEAVFNKTVQILSKKQVIGIFPEATHWGFRKLRSTKKAVARVALMAEEANDFKLGINIIPVGLYYDNYTNFRRNIIIIYGEPFKLDEFFEMYKENENKAFLQIRYKLDAEMKKYMIHINSNDNYEDYEMLREILDDATVEKFDFKGHDKILTKFYAQKTAIEIVENTEKNNPEIFNNIISNLQSYKEKRQKLKFRENTIKKGLVSFPVLAIKLISLLLCLPIFLYGFVFNIIPFYFPNKYITEKKIADVQFRNSINFVLGVILFPLFYIIMSVIFLFIFNFGLLNFLIFFISMPAFGLVAFRYYKVYKKTIASVRLAFNKKYATELIEIRNSIVNEYLEIANEYPEVAEHYKKANTERNLKNNISYYF